MPLPIHTAVFAICCFMIPLKRCVMFAIQIEMIQRLNVSQYSIELGNVQDDDFRQRGISMPVAPGERPMAELRDAPWCMALLALKIFHSLNPSHPHARLLVRHLCCLRCKASSCSPILVKTVEKTQ